MIAKRGLRGTLYDPGAQEVESGVPEVQVHPELHGKFKDSLRYVRPGVEGWEVHTTIFPYNARGQNYEINVWGGLILPRASLRALRMFVVCPVLKWSLLHGNLCSSHPMRIPVTLHWHPP